MVHGWCSGRRRQEAERVRWWLRKGRFQNRRRKMAAVLHLGRIIFDLFLPSLFVLPFHPPAIIIKILPQIHIPAWPLVKLPVKPMTSTPPPRVPEKHGHEDSDEDGASSSDVPAVKHVY
ncbi:hypothetical protein Hypma_003755 [Hypsizygus marmoreus]|uniref:Uncharacterized protein n=1 Tax=Hypsizygus marmoreus TaxID=39966 RepID=A0A369JAH6_HYPMA|nr:hypothetical protein Hypma_003755 [Hypsizygus marmoreus]